MSREPCNNIATNLQQHCNNIATNLQSKEALQRAINEMCGHCRYEHGSHACQNAECSRRICVDALRSELDRVGCEYCNDGEAMACGQDSLRRAGYIYLDGNLLTADLYSDSMAVAVCYCPMCGKKLEVEHE